MSKPLFLLVVLSLSSLPALIQAQTDPNARPRRIQSPPAVAYESDHPAPATELSDHPAPSIQANAEAKRLYKVGVKYGNARLFKQAASTFAQAVKLNPDYADAYLALGRAYYDLGQWEQAINSLQRGLALKPKDKAAQDRLAQAQRMLAPETGSRVESPSDGNGDGQQAEVPVASLSSSPATSRLPANDSDLSKVYRVGPGDVLDVRLTESASGHATLFTVTATGLLEHPDLSAPLPATGFTVQEISTRIEDDLKQKSPTKKPTVSVVVEEYVSHRILVSGLVKEPGTKILQRDAIPLYVVVADAQPLPEAGRVNVARNESHESYVIDLLSPAEMNLLVRPGDVITLQPNPEQFYYLGGEVKSPGEKTFRRGLTLTQVIIAAGGLTTNSKEARLARDNGKGFLAVSRYRLKDIESGKIPDPVIEPGDRITIE
jgi:polysaccharide export outer membrane protein